MHLRVTASRTVYDEDAGYPMSDFQTVIDDLDNDVAEYTDVLRLDGNHWTLDDATTEAISFVPSHHQNLQVRRSLGAHAVVLRAMTDTFNEVHDAGGDVTKLLGHIPPDRAVDVAAITDAAAQEVNSSRPRRHHPALPSAPWTAPEPSHTATRPSSRL